MRAYVANGIGTNALSIEEVPEPGPLAKGQIRIAMRAASVNYRDTIMLSGAFAAPKGFVPCSDGAGEVVEAALEVTRFKVGDRVSLIFNPDWIGGEFASSAGASGRGSNAVPGTMQEMIVVHHSEAVMVPTHLSFEEAASYPCAGVTAWYALTASRPLQPGMTVLLQGAGGVSTFALQFAKLFGARVIMLSSSAERCAHLRAMGADETINYKAEPEWDAAVRAMTGGQGVDLTVEVGGAETIERSLRATRNGGKLALVGLLTGRSNAVQSLASSGVEPFSTKVGSRRDYEAMNRAVAFHHSRPVIAARYGFAELHRALEHLKSGLQFGKIVLGFK
jgi:NADPH:quinone reductase-like Zn-dependent oxidoreductase